MKNILYGDVTIPTNPITGDVVLKDGEFLMWEGNGWVAVQMEPGNGYRKEELLDEFEKNPELFNEIMVEIRNLKINNITKNK